MKKLMFIAAAFIAVTVSSCTKDTTVAPTKVKTNLAIGGRDTISNIANARKVKTASDTISNILVIKEKATIN